MLRLILLLLLVLAAVLVYRSLSRKSAPPRQPRGHAELQTPERMVTCAHCGLRLPESDSVRVDGRHFCSEEHRRLAR